MCDVAWPSSTSNRRLQDSYLRPATDGRASSIHVMDGTRYYVVPMSQTLL